MDNYKQCTVQIHLNGRWHDAGTVTLKGEEKYGTGAEAIFEYDNEYVFNHLGKNGVESVSLRLPVMFDPVEERHWPSFLLDIMPNGASRRYWTKEMNIMDNASADWKLLREYSSNPPGNLRIRESADKLRVSNHKGFTQDDIINKSEYFIEYARKCGACVTGSSGLQGEAPKFPVSLDKNGRWHPGGSQPEENIKSEWIVKFPRGRSHEDRIILKSETDYQTIAAYAGLKTIKGYQWIKNCLFIPRFDIMYSNNKAIRFGMETAAAMTGIYEFGTNPGMEKICGRIRAYSTCPYEDLREFICRDILNFAMGNTDNHSRNTSIIKYDNGDITLSPIYDFAPMMIDPEFILRSCRWPKPYEKGHFPLWKEISKEIFTDEEKQKIRCDLIVFIDKIKILPAKLKSIKANQEITERCNLNCREIVKEWKNATNTW